MNIQKTNSFLNKSILILLTIQIASVGISIAVSSIAFGIWIGLWLIQIIINKKIQFDFSGIPEIKPVSFFIMLYIFFEILSRFFAIYPEGAFANLKRLLLFLIFYVSVIKVISFDILSKIILINFIAVSAISLIELVKYAIRFNELISTMSFSEIRIDYFNYPLTSAEIKMMVILSLLPVFFIKEKFLLRKSLLILLSVPMLISIFLTQSRNVFLAMAVCFLIYGIFYNRKSLIGFIIAAVILWIAAPSGVSDRFRSIIDVNHPSNASRLSMWKVGWQMFKDHPLTGVADSHIREIYETYKTPETQGEGVHLHNNFIMILATTGIFGFLTYLGFMLSLFITQIKYFLREKLLLSKSLILGSLLVIISFTIAGIFEWTFGDHEVMTVFFFLIAIPFVIKNKELIK